MSKSMDRQRIEQAVIGLERAASDPEKAAAVGRLAFSIQKLVEAADERSVNQGDYDCAVGLVAIRDDLRGYNDYREIVEFLGLQDDLITAGLLADLLVQRLVDDGVLLYVHDRQRVRSRIAEMARYLARLRQRFDPATYQDSPGLAQMVKLRARSRRRPRRGLRLEEVIKQIVQEKDRVDLDEAIARIFVDDPRRFNGALLLLHEVIEEVIAAGEGGVQLSQFQSDAWVGLFRQLVDRTFDSDRLSFVISSGTGSGKTEAFLYPLLLYTLLTREEKGTKGILVYPRIDLCNNQLERLFRYAFLINQKRPESRPIRISIQHSGTGRISIPCPHPGCNGTVRLSNNAFSCSLDPDHQFDWLVDKFHNADIVITTPDSLHRRLMDRYGRKNLFAPSRMMPKLIVFDEAHLYSEQAGIHVVNLVRRLRYRIRTAPEHQRLSRNRERSGNRDPLFVAVSATIGDPEQFGRTLFSTTDVEVVRARRQDEDEVGREYILFVKATDPRRVRIEDDEDGTEHYTTATNLSAMIQAAFCFYHTIRKDDQKNRLLGFVDSIDGIKRLGSTLYSADTKNTLWQLRTPDERIDTMLNPLCARCECREAPPHPHLQRCPVYDAGECWWLMEQRDLRPMTIQIHKSGTTQDCQGNPVDSDIWDLMITTSSLEVGFDHPGIIGTFQYRAPRSVPGFVQRIGRGGRAPQDMPVALVVFGTAPQDRFFFHHTGYLTDPTDAQLSIPLDAGNRYVRNMHITSFVYDYIALTGDESTVQSAYHEINAETVLETLSNPDGSLARAICMTFDIPLEEAEDILERLRSYYTSCLEPLLPGKPETRYDRLVGYWGHRNVTEEILEPLKELNVRMEYEDG